METAGLAAILTNQHCLARTSTEKLGAEMCFSWQDLPQWFCNKARPGSQHHIWPGCTASGGKTPWKSVVTDNFELCSSCDSQQSCLGTDPVIYDSYNFVRNRKQNSGFSFSTLQKFIPFLFQLTQQSHDMRLSH